MEKYTQKLLKIANALRDAADGLVELAEEMSSASGIDKTPKIQTQEQLSSAEFRRMLAPYFKEDRQLFQDVLARFGVKSLPEIKEATYNDFIQAVKAAFEEDAA